MLHLRQLGIILSRALHCHCCTPLSNLGTLKMVVFPPCTPNTSAEQGNIIVLVDEELQSQKTRWCIRTLRLEQVSYFPKFRVHFLTFEQSFLSIRHECYLCTQDELRIWCFWIRRNIDDCLCNWGGGVCTYSDLNTNFGVPHKDKSKIHQLGHFW